MNVRRILPRLIVTGVLATALVGIPLLTRPAAAQTQTVVFDHLKCFGILKEGLKHRVYTADLNAKDAQIFPPEFGDRLVDGKLTKGCRVTVPARFFCEPVSKTNVSDVNSGEPPPGASPGPPAPELLCYALKCPADKNRPSLNVADQFGSRSITLRDVPALLCTQATTSTAPTPTGGPTPTPTSSGAPTPTPTGVPPPTPTPTGAPTPTPTGAPTPTPTGAATPTPTGAPTPTPTGIVVPTPTPTGGSASGAFLDGLHLTF